MKTPIEDSWSICTCKACVQNIKLGSIISVSALAVTLPKTHPNYIHMLNNYSEAAKSDLVPL